MRVLHVDTAREWRGGQTQLLHLVRGAPDQAVALPPDAPLRPALEEAGVSVFPVDFQGVWRGTAALRRAAGAAGAELVAAQTSHGHGHAVLARTGLPVVVHRRLDFAPGRDPLTRLKYRLPQGYVAVSTAVARILEQAGVPSERIAVVHDGVDPAPLLHPRGLREVTRHRLGLPADAPLVGAVGALVLHKGHRHLVEAMVGLEAHLVIAGEGPLRADLEAQIQRLGLQDRVLLVGRVEDVPALIEALDLFAHPSVEEGMGQAVVEAMLAGVPVVATSAGGLVDVVEDGISGVLVAPGRAGALTRAISAGLRGPGAAKRRATVARERALSRFSVERMVGETLAAYARLGAR